MNEDKQAALEAYYQSERKYVLADNSQVIRG